MSHSTSYNPGYMDIEEPCENCGHERGAHDKRGCKIGGLLKIRGRLIDCDCECREFEPESAWLASQEGKP